jgi:glycosyltransferase involved in cell wall biosynthesis
MRVAIVYDCLFPYTVGGAERWYRGLAERLASRHQVTYLTRRQWSGAAPSDPPRGVAVIAVSGGGPLYTASGRRAIVPPLRFGLGLFGHLIRNRRRYDVVHTCGFPYFSMLAAGAARALGGPPVVADWFEVWPREYWRSYLGGVRGAIGEAIQRACIRLSRHAFVFSELYARQLVAAGCRADPIVLRGMYDDLAEPLDSPERKPVVIFAGRHIREKGVTAIPAAIAAARRTIPGLCGMIFGDGPERATVLAEVARLGLTGVIECPGFRPWDEIDRAMRGAMCILLPSAREGYGLVIVEAAARGTPSIVAREPASAATELIDEGINGFIASSAEPDALAEAIVRVHRAGAAIVRSTGNWFAANAQRLSIDASIEQIDGVYRAMVQRRLMSR